MKLFKLLSLAAITLLLMLPAASAQTSLQNLSVTALVDGRDLLYITPQAIHWHHLDYVAVGLYGGNFPTGLAMNNHKPNRQYLSWIPQWPCPPDNPACVWLQVDSSEFRFASPLPSQYQLTKLSVTQAPGGGSVSVYQSPDPDNGYITIVDFNDDPLGGPHFYTAVLAFAPISGAGVIGGSVNGPPQMTTPPPPDGLITIYSNLGTGDGVYNCCIGFTTAGRGSPLGKYIEVGNAFTPADNYTITEVQLAVGYALGRNAVTVGIWSDNNGVPGAPIKQWYPNNLRSDGTCCRLRTIREPTEYLVSLTAGTQYWFVVRQCVDSSDSWNVWNLNTNNAFGPVALKVGQEAWANEGDQLQGAFAILGK